MLKYVDTLVGFSEIPDEISLCINLSNCIHSCPGCHSSYLQTDVGKELTPEVLDKLIENNDGITCVCLMGGENDLMRVNLLMHHCSNKHSKLKRAIYIGSPVFPRFLDIKLFDYIKIGEYNKDRGGLDNPNTNQQLKKLTRINSILNIEDITYKFWKK